MQAAWGVELVLVRTCKIVSLVWQLIPERRDVMILLRSCFKVLSELKPGIIALCGASGPEPVLAARAGARMQGEMESQPAPFVPSASSTASSSLFANPVAVPSLPQAMVRATGALN